MPLEHEIVPFVVSEPAGTNVLFLAPHPDDETFSSGGTIRLMVEKGGMVKVVFLTSGEMAGPSGGAGGKNVSDYAKMREDEARKALGVLGVEKHVFMRLPDRGLWQRLDAAIGALKEMIEDSSFDCIYSPSPVELNPDHRATASIALKLREFFGLGLVFYEVATPLRPNRLVDITGVYKRKIKAAKAYKSQLAIRDYQGHFDSINRLRTLTVEKAGRAEAFWVFEATGGADDIKGWMSFGWETDMLEKGHNYAS